MYELSIAKKYLSPRWRQLSVSIISLISILVIALVVWLIVVFFSVTTGLEKSWINKLIALTAPVRIIPTDHYYRSYYYQIDSISENSGYSLKTLGEKLQASAADPYDPSRDEEPPSSWPPPFVDSEGQLKDLVKEAFAIVNQQQHIPGLQAADFEMTVGTLRLQLLRPSSPSILASRFQKNGFEQSQLQQATYLGSLDPFNRTLAEAALPLTMQDLNNIFSMLSIDSDNFKEDDLNSIQEASKDNFQNRLKTFLSFIEIQELKTPNVPWILPFSLFPKTAQFQALGLYKDDNLFKIAIPNHAKSLNSLRALLNQQGIEIKPVSIEFRDHKPFFASHRDEIVELPAYVPISIEPDLALPASLVPSSLDTASKTGDLLFDVSFSLQNVPFKGRASYGPLKIHKVQVIDTLTSQPEKIPFWLYQIKEKDRFLYLGLPSDPSLGEGVLLPRPFRDTGVLAGDRGFISYMTPTASTVQEQRIPIFVAGFYDPGVIPIGGKYILANREVTGLLRSSHNQEDTSLSNGINVRFDNLEQADEVKALLQQAFREANIDPYWRIETYREYDFTKDLIQQLHSEKNLFSLLATIIIIVACSNIVSMLIILVNDKKTEIGILRSMGASSFSIAAIFGTCGVIMGILGSLLGISAAVVTLKNLQPLIHLLSKIQGHEMFNPIFFGETLPTELSYETLGFVILATSLISLISGLVPALKASLLRPSSILRSE